MSVSISRAVAVWVVSGASALSRNTTIPVMQAKPSA
jgi:hypothetical protein